MSGPVVVIGYILLIPSVLGMLASAFTCFMTPASVSVAHQGMADATRQRLIAARIPQVLINKVSNSEVISAADRTGLTPEQRRELDATQLALAAGTTGSALGGAFLGGGAVCFGISCFVGGLLGWLLIMKKKVLQCDQCGAVVAAS